jgi:hypothetical protein
VTITIDLDPTTSPVRYAGSADVVRADGDDGWVVHRLPRSTAPQILDPALGLLVAVPSGARLELVTDATTIELDVALLLLRLSANPTIPAAFDLVVDGEVHTQTTTVDATVLVIDQATGAISFEPGSPTTTVTFADLPPGEKQVEVWLPHASVVTLQALRVDDGAHVAAPPPSERRRWVHYGSSISHCLEANHPTETWPATVARLADLDLHSVAFAGQCQLDQFVARTIRDRPADLISLKVGINIVNGDTMRERVFGPAVNGFLDTVREGHPDTPIVFVTPIICPVHEDHPGPSMPGPAGITTADRPDPLAVGSLTLRRIRTLIGEIVATRRDLGDTDLHLVDGLSLFGEADTTDLPDGLHPNAAGYLRIGQRFHQAVCTGSGPFAG